MTSEEDPTGQDRPEKRQQISPRATKEALFQQAIRDIEERHGRDRPHRRDDRLRWLERFVGGEEVLAKLHSAPFPDEPLNLDGLAVDILDRLDFIGLLADDARWKLFGSEHHTATRALLHDLALRDPAIFRRSSSDPMAAAAVCWIVAELNCTLGYYRIQVQDLTAHLQLQSSPSARAKVFLEAIGGRPNFDTIGLGTERHLTSATRARLIRAREEVRDPT